MYMYIVSWLSACCHVDHIFVRSFYQTSMLKLISRFKTGADPDLSFKELKNKLYGIKVNSTCRSKCWWLMKINLMVIEMYVGSIQYSWHGYYMYLTKYSIDSKKCKTLFLRLIIISSGNMSIKKSLCKSFFKIIVFVGFQYLKTRFIIDIIECFQVLVLRKKSIPHLY